MKTASFCIQFIFFNFVFHFFFLLTFRRTALTSPPSSSSMCVFDVYRLTNCMRDILASTSNTPNSVERMFLIIISIYNAFTVVKYWNMSVPIYYYSAAEGTFKMCGCRRLAGVRHVRNLISQRNRCNDQAPIYPCWTNAKCVQFGIVVGKASWSFLSYTPTHIHVSLDIQLNFRWLNTGAFHFNMQNSIRHSTNMSSSFSSGVYEVSFIGYGEPLVNFH